MNTLNRRAVLAGAAALPALSLPISALAQESVSEQELLVAGPLGDKALGDENATVTVVEYASMTCGFCGRFHRQTWAAFKEKYVDTGKVRFIFREFPLDASAFAVAMLARCAPADRFFDIIDLYFTTQDTWLASQDRYNALLDLAKQAGFSKESFDACLANQALFEGLDEVKNRGARKFGITGTPTFFINGAKAVGALSLEQMASYIDPKL
ncbi:MAG TPA: DsbA family protein [Afifellaceae bacterium]|nr:DsbA family protein [Afifellaceae bacterium]